MTRKPIAARLGPLPVLLVLVAGLAGCERKFTRERFEMIREGVDEREDVKHLLGKPETTFADSDQWYYEDEDEHYSALIHFGPDGKVAAKQWMDARTGEFTGDAPDADAPPEGEIRERRTRTRRIDDD